jgi:hypothetical protein
MEPRLGEVGHPAEPVEIVGPEEDEPVVTSQPLTGLDLVPERYKLSIEDEGGQSGGNGHGRLRVRVRPTSRSDSIDPDFLLSSRANPRPY